MVVFFSKLSKPVVLSSCILGILFYAGFFFPDDPHPYRSLLPKKNIIAVEGSVFSNPVITSNGKYYSMKISLTKSIGRFYFGESAYSASGVMKVLVPCRIVESLYPGKLFSSSGTGILFETDESVGLEGSWSERSGVFIVDSAYSVAEKKTVLKKICHFRALCRLAFKRLMYSWGAAGGFILALLSGSKEYIASGTGEKFRLAGLSHILALSGMHLSFFAGLIGGGEKFLGKKYSFWLKVSGIVFFVWFAGLSPSLFRALIFAFISLVSSAVFCAGINLLYVLCGSFILHCCISPDEIYEASFMLSYGALAGILVLGEFFTVLYGRIFPEKISSPLGAGTGAQIFTAPVSAVLFGQIAPVGIIASVVVSPLVSFFFAFSIVAIICSFIVPCLQGIFGAVITLFYMLIIFATGIFSKFPLIELR